MTTPIDRTELVDEGADRETFGLVHRVRRGSGRAPHPTIVMLHGRYGDEDAMWLLGPTLPRDWLVVAPRAPIADPLGGYDWRPRKPDEWPTLDDFAPAVDAVTRFVRALPEAYGASTEAMYFMGFSQGAATAYATAIAHRHLVAGIAGIVGFVPTQCESLAELRPLQDLPVFMAVGRRDHLIPLSRSQACAYTLREIGADLTYREYDAGHKLSTEGMRDLRAWWSERPEVARA